MNPLYNGPTSFDDAYRDEQFESDVESRARLYLPHELKRHDLAAEAIANAITDDDCKLLLTDPCEFGQRCAAYVRTAAWERATDIARFELVQHPRKRYAY